MRSRRPAARRWLGNHGAVNRRMDSSQLKRDQRLLPSSSHGSVPTTHSTDRQYSDRYSLAVGVGGLPDDRWPGHPVQDLSSASNHTSRIRIGRGQPELLRIRRYSTSTTEDESREPASERCSLPSNVTSRPPR